MHFGDSYRLSAWLETSTSPVMVAAIEKIIRETLE
jgi:hypothetical protein